ncbi:efflux RND transporter permease subunit [Parachitinimonas caeni]|uniref:Efflux RND transporter permease subunit n=1 Tax=Parachitinimonas caeni TaxID=3031301 RepID=A0ABT7DX59_9NEIS|nr:efflux RND transporter permease subunit [Parachitinimonas caeni]MDK2124574.1 efflux RND transporter permease subunit [Parachitinimonas caeni]
MNLSELCIRRPIATVLLCIAAIVAGLVAYRKLPIAALPSFNSPTINVSANLPGANPETMAAAVATPLEKQFSTIAGIETISSTNTLGNTSITLEFSADRDIDAAAVDVQAALLRAQRALPAEMTSLPSYRKVNPADSPILLLGLSSPSLSLAAINEFADSVISPSLSTINGVAQVQNFGQKRYAVRVQVDPDRLAARNLSFDELAAGLKTANSNSPLGVIEGPRQVLTLQSNRQLLNAAEFAELIVAVRNGQPVQLRDVATVSDSVESVKTASWVNGERAIVLAVMRQPNANTVAVVDAIKAALPRFRSQLPGSVKLEVMNDRSQSIRESLHDVNLTLGLTVVLVVLVIFLFLRRAMATLIPALSLPVSLIGTFSLMYWLGYSLDNISLLGLTLAVGLVVDDAIVVLENIVRHIEEGMPPFEAAIKGSKEMGFTIISISVSLVAVFIPIFFMPGVIGLLLHEFAVVVSLAVLVSALVSLTLIPMFASRFLHHDDPSREPGWSRLAERGFQKVLDAYRHSLDLALRHRRWVLAAALATFAGSVWLFVAIPKGFFPNEDIGQLIVNVEAAQDVSYERMLVLRQQVGRIIEADPAVATVTASVGQGGSNNARFFVSLKPRSQRPHIDKVVEGMRRKTGSVAGVSVFYSPTQNLRIGGRQAKSRYQYTLQSVHAEELNQWAEKMRETLRGDPMFRDVTSDAQLRGLQAMVEIDRDRANRLGVALQDIRSALYSAFGDRQVATIYTATDDYQVIMETSPQFRADEAAIGRLQIRSRNGNLVPLSSMATVKRMAAATAVNHQGQLQAVTLSFNTAPGVPLGDAARRIDELKNRLGLPPTVLGGFAGDAAAFQQTQGNQVWLIVAAVLVIYVLLGVLYESFIHPITILAGIPSAAIGALGALWLLDLELTVIALIGLLMLIGIVKKNAIMMIDFALVAQRDHAAEPAAAIREACLLRFRPILMTTLAALMGALPLAFGWGAGAELRQPLGVAVVGGLIFSQLITLYITPVLYLYFERLSASRATAGALQTA